jgi:hypothetical protein
MKKSYIKPIIEVVVSIAEMPLLIGSISIMQIRR